MKNKKTITELESLIKGMREDGEIFGLVCEDWAKISKWKKEIIILREK